MATKKKATVNTLQGRLDSLQAEAEKQLRAGFDRTIELLPAEPRKAVKKLTADVDKVRRDLRKRAEGAVNDARKRAERFAADVQKQVEKVVVPVADRLAVASRSDLNALRKRVDHLEKKLDAQVRTAAPTHAPHHGTSAA